MFAVLPTRLSNMSNIVSTRVFPPITLVLIGLALSVVPGCQLPQTQAQPSDRRNSQKDQPPAVEAAVAEQGSVNQGLQYTGTTAPGQLVSLRAQAEGRLLNLNVNVGDAVSQGQRIGNLDDRLPTTAINEARAELASRESDVDRAISEVSDAQVQVVQAEVVLKQARADAKRLKNLADKGAIPQQQAEQAQTNAESAAQVLRSAQEQVRTRQQAVEAAEGRVASQFANVSAAQARGAYSSLNAPITGIVTERLTEPGNLIQPGNEILKIGNFSSIKITTQVSELDLTRITVGQTVQVKLDALPKLDFQGKVSRITPIADITSRLIPVEISVANIGNRISGGLLARVEFGGNSQMQQRVVVPQSALNPESAGGSRSSGSGKKPSGPKASNPQTSLSAASALPKTTTAKATTGNIYIVEQIADNPTIAVRAVTLGQTRNGQVEVISGLKPGESYVVRSDKPLEAGQVVRLSILSKS